MPRIAGNAATNLARRSFVLPWSKAGRSLSLPPRGTYDAVEQTLDDALAKIRHCIESYSQIL
jgi:hypothetical protein